MYEALWYLIIEPFVGRSRQSHPPPPSNLTSIEASTRRVKSVLISNEMIENTLFFSFLLFSARNVAPENNQVSLRNQEDAGVKPLRLAYLPPCKHKVHPQLSSCS